MLTETSLALHLGVAPRSAPLPPRSADRRLLAVIKGAFPWRRYLPFFDVVASMPRRGGLPRSHRGTSFVLLAFFLALASTGCGKHGSLAPPAAPLSAPSRLCSRHEAPPACRSAAQLEELLGERAKVLGVSETPSGMQGAKVLTLRSEWKGTRVVFRAKWRPQSSGDLVNEPRKELAAYAVQKLFLDDDQLAAPPTAPHCFPLDEYRRFDPEAEASFPEADCVFGFASYWLESAQSVSSAREHGILPEGAGIWDAQLFARDPVYRASVANANLLTYLINHGDAHDEQFLIERTPRGLRAYVVDNSISFLSAKNPMLLFREDWSHIQVPRLPGAAIERLSRLTQEDFARLGTLAVFERKGRQLLLRPGAEALQSDGSTMSWKGPLLRVGLTTLEIQLVESRVRDLLKRADLARITDR